MPTPEVNIPPKAFFIGKTREYTMPRIPKRFPPKSRERKRAEAIGNPARSVRKIASVFKWSAFLRSRRTIDNTAIAVIGGSGGGFLAAWGAHSGYPLLAIPAAAALASGHWKAAGKYQKAEQELEAKLIGKAALGEKIAKRLQNPGLRQKVLFLTQQLFLPKTELKPLRQAVAAGNLTVEGKQVLWQGHRLFELEQQNPEPTRQLARTLFNRKGNSFQTRAFLITSLETIFRAPQTPHVIEIGHLGYSERWAVRQMPGGKWLIQRESRPEDQ